MQKRGSCYKFLKETDLDAAEIEKLKAQLPDQFSRTMLDGAIEVLGSDNVIRANQFAAALRELVGYLLHNMAPDDKVVAALSMVVEDSAERG